MQVIIHENLIYLRHEQMLAEAERIHLAARALINSMVQYLIDWVAFYPDGAVTSKIALVTRILSIRLSRWIGESMYYTIVTLVELFAERIRNV
jgi:hypothetical protein